MSDIQVAVSASIDAPPARVYEVLADYRNHHPNILPKAYFAKVEITKGGQGVGTEFVANMNIYGSKRTFHMTVSEPEPGRVLAETDAKLGTYTTFTVEPLEGGAKSKVTIATTSKASTGIGSWLERLTTPMIMRKIYQEELEQLNAYMQQLPADR
ncbi:MAG: SRPBCC family protein [Caldilineaceae bacterium]